MNVAAFEKLIAGLTGEIAGVALGSALEAHLNAEHGPGSLSYDALFAACQAGVRDGWLCQREGGGIRYGRVLKASEATHGSASTSSTWKASKGRTTRTRTARST